jgi:hypothetical protein
LKTGYLLGLGDGSLAQTVLSLRESRDD